MKIILAKDAGYCFGVRDAVNSAYEMSKKYGEVYMLGDIVHNESVVSDLEKEGVKVCLLYTSPSPRDMRRSRMPSSA